MSKQHDDSEELVLRLNAAGVLAAICRDGRTLERLRNSLVNEAMAARALFVVNLVEGEIFHADDPTGDLATVYGNRRTATEEEFRRVGLSIEQLRVWEGMSP